MDNNSDVYKSFVLLDYFQPKLCADIRAFLATATNPEQLEIAQKSLRDTLVYLLNERHAQIKDAAEQPAEITQNG